jgi:hypothetical protein
MSWFLCAAHSTAHRSWLSAMLIRPIIPHSQSGLRVGPPTGLGSSKASGPSGKGFVDQRKAGRQGLGPPGRLGLLLTASCKTKGRGAPALFRKTVHCELVCGLLQKARRDLNRTSKMKTSCSFGQEWLGSSVQTFRKLGEAVLVMFEHRLALQVTDRLVLLK